MMSQQHSPLETQRTMQKQNVECTAVIDDVTLKRGC